MADLSEDTVNALQKIYPSWMPVSNPIDIWPAVEMHGRKKVYAEAFKAICADPGVDAVLFHSFVGGLASSDNISNLVEMTRAAGKPLFGWLMGKRDDAHQFQLEARKLGLPVFGELYRAVECMAAVFKRSSYLERRRH